MNRASDKPDHSGKQALCARVISGVSCE